MVSIGRDRYRGIVAAAAALPCRTAILAPQTSRGFRRRCDRAGRIFYAFDLFHLDGSDLRERPLTQRRTKLKELLGDNASSALQFSEDFVGDGAAFFRACAEHRLEGIASNLASSRALLSGFLRRLR
jgi:bifunctional non-homologous end joining protein LigD